MNIKEIKANYEKATSIVLKSMVAENVQVEVGYDVSNDLMNVNLISNSKGRSGEDVVILYSVSYNNEKKTMSIAAIARHLVADNFGYANIMYEPIYVDEEFFGNLKQGFMVALEHYEEIIANQEKVEAANDATEAAETDAEPVADADAE